MTENRGKKGKIKGQKNFSFADLSYRQWVLYIIVLAVVMSCAGLLFEIGMGTNTQGGRCAFETWKEGKIYQWVYDGMPCVYTRDFLIGYYFFFMLYLLFDYIRRKIIAFNPLVSVRLEELGVFFAVNWGLVLWQTANFYAPLDSALIYGSFLGTLRFFLPLILFMMIVQRMSSKSVLWLLGGMILLYGMFLLCLSLSFLR